MMKVQMIAKIAVCAILLVSVIKLGAVIHAHGEKLEQARQIKKDFRYIIFSNEIDETGRPHDTWRKVKVLLDGDAFSEETLKNLFNLLSDRFPSPEWLKLEVYTNLNQIPTPEEADKPQISGSNDKPEHDKYHWAFMLRFQGNELFRYNPDPPNKIIKTVVLKGRDPF